MENYKTMVKFTVAFHNCDSFNNFEFPGLFQKSSFKKKYCLENYQLPDVQTLFSFLDVSLKVD